MGVVSLARFSCLLFLSIRNMHTFICCNVCLCYPPKLRFIRNRGNEDKRMDRPVQWAQDLDHILCVSTALWSIKVASFSRLWDILDIYKKYLLPTRIHTRVVNSIFSSMANAVNRRYNFSTGSFPTPLYAVVGHRMEGRPSTASSSIFLFVHSRRYQRNRNANTGWNRPDEGAHWW